MHFVFTLIMAPYGLRKNGPTGSYILSHQGVALFERIRRRGLVGQSVSLGMGFEILSLLVDQDVALSYCSSATSATMILP